MNSNLIRDDFENKMEVRLAKSNVYLLVDKLQKIEILIRDTAIKMRKSNSQEEREEDQEYTGKMI